MRHFTLRAAALMVSVLLLAAPALATADTGTVNTCTLRFRAGPCTSAAILALLSEGDSVTIVDATPIENASGTWVKIQHNGRTGYVMAEFLGDSDGTVSARATVSVPRLNFRAGPSTSAAVLMVVENGVTATILNNETDGWVKAEIEGVTGYIRAEFISLPGSGGGSSGGAAGKFGQVTASRVNFRAEADLDAAVNSILPIGSGADGFGG